MANAVLRVESPRKEGRTTRSINLPPVGHRGCARYISKLCIAAAVSLAVAGPVHAQQVDDHTTCLELLREMNGDGSLVRYAFYILKTYETLAPEVPQDTDDARTGLMMATWMRCKRSPGLSLSGAIEQNVADTRDAMRR
jgi:hypothetical protein